MVRCHCSCGTEKDVRLKNIIRGISISCGCLKKERTSEARTTHGMCKSRTYKSWAGMVERGTGKVKRSSYADRGITVCKRWLQFENFLSDMGEAPEGCSIDRINNNKGYYPKNCRWATAEVQARNTRRNRWIVYKGERMCLADAAVRFGVKREALALRLNAGWPVKKALETPTKNKKTIVTFQGEMMTLSEAAKKSGIPRATLQSRVYMGHIDKLFYPVGCVRNYYAK